MKVMQRTADDSGTGGISQPAVAASSIQPFIHTAHGLAMKFLQCFILSWFRMSEQPVFAKALHLTELFSRQ